MKSKDICKFSSDIPQQNGAISVPIDRQVPHPAEAGWAGSLPIRPVPNRGRGRKNSHFFLKVVEWGRGEATRTIKRVRSPLNPFFNRPPTSDPATEIIENRIHHRHDEKC